MKKIKKIPKKVKKSKVALNLPTKKVKSTPGYYLCMGTDCQGQNIAQVAQKCKNNAPNLMVQKTKKIKELAQAAKIIGKFAQDLEKVLPR